MSDVHIERMKACGVIPVVSVPDAAAAVSLANALLEGGIDVIELTLRTAAGLAAIEAVARSCPGMFVIAGTVVQPAQFAQVRDAGAKAVVSPGFSETLDDAARAAGLPWLPGVATASEVMRAGERGRTALKFFPAELAGGIAMIKALAGPFPNVVFCPTGGVNTDNLGDYLALKTVMCVGGTWLTPAASVAAGDWGAIRDEAARARRKVDEIRAA
jgi:2-dehydro-3-deoxyphosphogluconate aldolase/(4S)-4-hydroxy-2-oxoglutarate aldolase